MRLTMTLVHEEDMLRVLEDLAGKRSWAASAWSAAR
jgi:hypothetical protein